MGPVTIQQPLRWAVVITDLDPVRGHEQRGTRRVLVVSYEPFHRSNCLTVCPITAVRSTVRYPNEVAIPFGEARQTKGGVILCHQVRTVSRARVTTAAPLGYLGDPTLRAPVRFALARHFGLDIPPAIDGASGADPFG